MEAGREAQEQRDADERRERGHHRLAALLRADEAAEYLAISRSKVYALIASGEIAPVRIGKSMRVPVAVLDDFIDRLRNQ